MKFKRSKAEISTLNSILFEILKTALAPICMYIRLNMVTPDMGIDLFNRTRWIKMTCLEFCLRPRETKSVYLYIDRMCIYCDDWKVDISYVRWMCAFLCGLCTLFEVIVCDVSDSMTLGSNSVFPTFSNSFSLFSAINHMDVSEIFSPIFCHIWDCYKFRYSLIQ